MLQAHLVYFLPDAGIRAGSKFKPYFLSLENTKIKIGGVSMFPAIGVSFF